ncbi:MAG: hypothetical protein BWZ03_00564 [bacterium ADurb.BinA186]|nr:MAG: hypothetical protein BWZ03_00564 [bacterium ADurb.BinA186]
MQRIEFIVHIIIGENKFFEFDCQAFKFFNHNFGLYLKNSAIRKSLFFIQIAYGLNLRLRNGGDFLILARIGKAFLNQAFNEILFDLGAKEIHNHVGWHFSWSKTRTGGNALNLIKCLSKLMAYNGARDGYGQFSFVVRKRFHSQFFNHIHSDHPKVDMARIG